MFDVSSLVLGKMNINMFTITAFYSEEATVKVARAGTEKGG